METQAGVHRVLVRLGLNRLAWMDRPTGRVIRRIVELDPDGEDLDGEQGDVRDVGWCARRSCCAFGPSPIPQQFTTLVSAEMRIAPASAVPIDAPS